jgi:hypothetical protein
MTVGALKLLAIPASRDGAIDKKQPRKSHLRLSGLLNYSTFWCAKPFALASFDIASSPRLIALCLWHWYIGPYKSVGLSVITLKSEGRRKKVFGRQKLSRRY